MQSDTQSTGFLPFTHCGVYRVSANALLLWVQLMSDVLPSQKEKLAVIGATQYSYCKAKRNLSEEV